VPICPPYSPLATDTEHRSVVGRRDERSSPDVAQRQTRTTERYPLEIVAHCQLRTRTHGESEHPFLHRWADRRHGRSTVTAYIELHEEPEARDRFLQVRGTRPEFSTLGRYAFSINWAGGARTDAHIAAERAAAEQRYEADQRLAAAALGLTVEALRRRHREGSEAVALEEELRRDAAWLRAEVASARDIAQLSSTFPDAVADLRTYRFAPSTWEGTPGTFAGRRRWPQIDALRSTSGLTETRRS